MYASSWKKKTEVLKGTEEIFSTLWETNLRWVLDEEN